METEQFNKIVEMLESAGGAALTGFQSVVAEYHTAHIVMAIVLAAIAIIGVLVADAGYKLEKDIVKKRDGREVSVAIAMQAIGIGVFFASSLFALGNLYNGLLAKFMVLRQLL